MRRHSRLNVAALCLALSACVTINVYFPAAAAEKAADKIIEDVWGPQGAPGGASEQGGETRAAIDDEAFGEGVRQRVLFAATASVLEFVIPSAHAQADLNIATPAVRLLTQSMEGRHAQLRKYYDSGAVGLTGGGLIEVRDQNLVPLPERNSVRKLVADENADRANLYSEIAVGNGHPEWEPDIRSTFAERWVSKASAGWYYQDSSGAWQRK